MAHVRFAARDPGGANVLAGVLTHWEQPASSTVDVWALPRAGEVFARAGITTRLFREPTEREHLERAWLAQPADFLITGTSHYEPFEPVLWELARASACPSLAMLDQWCNLDRRFVEGQPDFVGAIDESQRRDLQALRFRSNQIIVTGHPWLSGLLEQRDRVVAATPRPLQPAGVRVLFVSESIASEVAEGRNAPYGFDEFDALTLLHRGAIKATQMGASVTLAVKFHPYEDPQPFVQRLATLKQRSEVTVMPLGRDERPYPWILWSDLVAGIGSTLLVEAIILGRPVVSVQPGLIREDTCIVSRQGYAPLLTEPHHAVEVLTSLILKPEERSRLFQRHQPFLAGLQTDGGRVVQEWITAHTASAMSER